MPGRNEPCPCGSGRKYKHCCLKANDAADFRWRQIRSAGERLSPTQGGFIESAVTSPICFYAVTRTVPGSEMALRDVLTGSEVVVRERSASGMVQPGALLFTRIVTVEGTSIMSGCAPLVIPPEWHLPIIDFRERVARGKGRMLTREALREMDIELRELYFYIEDQVWNPKLPELRNTDGDRLVL